MVLISSQVDANTEDSSRIRAVNVLRRGIGFPL